MKLQIQKNILHYCIDLLRGKKWYETGGVLNNVIKTMQESRHDKICGEDFSDLDFKNIIFNNISWSFRGEMASSFVNCRLYESNFVSGHKDTILCASFSDDSTCFVTASKDGMAIIWSTISGKILAVFHPENNYGEICYAGFIEPGLCLFVTEMGYFIRWHWDNNRYEVLHLWENADYDYADVSHLSEVAFSGNGNQCLLMSKTDRCRIWSLDNGNLHRPSTKYQNAIAISHKTNKLLIGGWGHSAWISKYNSKTNEILTGEDVKLNLPTRLGPSVGTFSLDEKYCIITGPGGMAPKDVNPDKYLPCDPECHTAFLCDANTGKLLHELNGHKGIIYAVDISPDSSKCITCSKDGTAIIWDIINGKPIITLKSVGSVYIAHFSHDSKLVLTVNSERTVQVWSTEDGRLLNQVFSFDGKITRILLSSDLRYTAMTYGRLGIWNNKGEIYREYITEFKSFFLCKELLSDNYLLVRNKDNCVCIFDILNNKPLHKILIEGKLKNISYSSMTKQLIIVDEKKSGKTEKTLNIEYDLYCEKIMLLKLDTNEKRNLLTIDMTGNNICITPNGKKLIVLKNRIIAIIYNLEKYEPVKEIFLSSSYNTYFDILYCSKNGRFFLFVDKDLKLFCILDTETYKRCVRNISIDPSVQIGKILDAWISDNGREIRIVLSSGMVLSLTLFFENELVHNNVLYNYKNFFESNILEITAGQISENGSVIALGYNKLYATLIDLRNGEIIHEYFPTFGANIRNCLFSASRTPLTLMRRLQQYGAKFE